MARSTRHSPARPDQGPTDLRIIGGNLRGRKIQYSGLARTRPMKDRVREAVFNLVGPAIRGKLAIDLFAGTGALGLEALSRGAGSATFVEQHFPTADIIRRNCAQLAVADRSQVVAADVFLWVERHLPDSKQPWVVFCSPPFAFYRERADDMARCVAQVLEQAPVDSILVVEADEHLDFDHLPGAPQWDVRHYPPAKVGVFRKRTPETAA